MVRRAFNVNRLRLRGDWCTYCGLVATTDDHFPPLAFTGSTGAGFIIPCCHECNCVLGANHPNSFSGRVAYIKTKIRRRNRKVLAHIEWSDEELAQISPKLSREYAAWRTKRLEVQERLAWNAESYLCLIVQRSGFADLNASLGFSEGSAPLWLTRLEVLW